MEVALACFSHWLAEIAKGDSGGDGGVSAASTPKKVWRKAELQQFDGSSTADWADGDTKTDRDYSCREWAYTVRIPNGVFRAI